ncbi:hypothetical protein ACFLSF_03660 [Candidatus Bipolaricaulota bacterium]
MARRRWTFVLWGVYHAFLLYAYHLAGRGGRWRPKTTPGTAAAWSTMALFTVFGWFLFRAPDLNWVGRALLHPSLGLRGDGWLAGLGYLGMMAFYSLPLVGTALVGRLFPQSRIARALLVGAAIVAIIVLSQDAGQDFIYFRF